MTISLIIICHLFDLLYIGVLKAKISEVTSIPTCRQSWCGWVQSENYNDSTALNTMNLSDENELIVNDTNDLTDMVAVDDANMERLTQTFKLNILIGGTNNTTPLQLNFPGTRSIADIKKDIYSVTNIAVRHQQWHGWPSGISDDTTLGLAGIPFEHNLVLNSTDTSINQIIPPTQAIAVEPARSNVANDLIEIDSDSSIDEFEDASDFNGDDEIFAAPATNRRRNDLSE